MKEPLISLKDISFSYDDGRAVFEGLNLDIHQGEMVLLEGGNGTGKTTLFFIILGLLKPQRGTVRLFGTQCTKEEDFRPPRRRIGFLFQDPDHQLFCPTVLEDVCFGLLNLGHTPNEAESKAMEVLRSLGIQHLALRSPYRLSGGEKRLSALATVLAMDPEVILLDEPFNALDGHAQKRIEKALFRLNVKAMILVSHHGLPRKGLFNKVIFMEEGGRLHQEASSLGTSTKKVVPFPA